MLRPARKKHRVIADTKHAHRVKFDNVRAIASEPTGTVPLFLRSAKDRFACVTQPRSLSARGKLNKLAARNPIPPRREVHSPSSVSGRRNLNATYINS